MVKYLHFALVVVLTLTFGASCRNTLKDNKHIKFFNRLPCSRMQSDNRLCKSVRVGADKWNMQNISMQHFALQERIRSIVQQISNATNPKHISASRKDIRKLIKNFSDKAFNEYDKIPNYINKCSIIDAIINRCKMIGDRNPSDCHQSNDDLLYQDLCDLLIELLPNKSNAVYGIILESIIDFKLWYLLVNIVKIEHAKKLLLRKTHLKEEKEELKEIFILPIGIWALKYNKEGLISYLGLGQHSSENVMVNDRDADHRTILFYAVQRSVMILNLIEQGVDVNVRDSIMIRNLIKQGADVNARDKDVCHRIR